MFKAGTKKSSVSSAKSSARFSSALELTALVKEKRGDA
jgi:hypothetical protein